MTPPTARRGSPSGHAPTRPNGQRPQEADRLRDLLRAPGYLKVLAFSALLGIPVSLVAFWFVVGLHEAEHLLWEELPHALGRDVPP